MRNLLIGLTLLCPLFAWAQESTPFEATGVWEVVSDDGEAEFITIGPQGSAIHSTRGRPDSNGTWCTEDGIIIIEWENGWVDNIAEEDGSVIRDAYPPGKDQPVTTTKMKRLETHPKTPKAASWGASVILDHCKS